MADSMSKVDELRKHTYVTPSCKEIMYFLSAVGSIRNISLSSEDPGADWREITPMAWGDAFVSDKIADAKTSDRIFTAMTGRETKK